MGQIKILRAGLYDTLQDLGRTQYRDIGVPHSGVMDLDSYQLGNSLLNHGGNVPVLEMTSQGGLYAFDKAAVIVITGAITCAVCNNVLIKNNVPTLINENDILKIGAFTKGIYAYLHILNGFKTKSVLKSDSMYKNITEKDVYKTGDFIDYNDLNVINKKVFLNDLVNKIKQNCKPEFVARKGIFKNRSLSVFLGPEFHLLPEELQRSLFTKSFAISINRNRMGIPLDSKLSNDLPLLKSAPVLPGTVQLTPDGMLIVLGNDAQTTGGYPRVLQLTEFSLSVLCQLSSREEVSFCVVK